MGVKPTCHFVWQLSNPILDWNSDLMSQQMPLSAKIDEWALECSGIEFTCFHVCVHGYCLFFSLFHFCQAVFNWRNVCQTVFVLVGLVMFFNSMNLDTKNGCGHFVSRFFTSAILGQDFKIFVIRIFPTLVFLYAPWITKRPTAFPINDETYSFSSFPS